MHGVPGLGPVSAQGLFSQHRFLVPVSINGVPAVPCKTLSTPVISALLLAIVLSCTHIEQELVNDYSLNSECSSINFCLEENKGNVWANYNVAIFNSVGLS